MIAITLKAKTYGASRFIERRRAPLRGVEPAVSAVRVATTSAKETAPFEVATQDESLIEEGNQQR